MYPDLIDGAILFLDFEKAFDLVLRHFIIRILSHLKFGDLYIKAVKLLLSSIEVVVMLNGFMSESFTPESGTPQRCPLSPGLFILVIEVLACALRAAKGDGLRCGTIFRSSMQAADDTAVLGRTPESLIERVSVVTKFCKAAGMRINWGKSFGVSFSRHDEFQQAVAHLDIKWATADQPIPERYLGFLHDTEFKDAVMLKNTMDTIDQRISDGSHVGFSLIERVRFLNSHVLSCLWYISPLVRPSGAWIFALETKIRAFLWQGKINRVALNQIYQSTDNGGLTLIDPRQHLTAQVLAFGAQMTIVDARPSASCWIAMLEEFFLAKYQCTFIQLIKGKRTSCKVPMLKELINTCRKYSHLFAVDGTKSPESIRDFKRLLQRETVMVACPSHWTVDINSWSKRWKMMFRISIAPKLKSFIYLLFYQRLATHEFVSRRTSKLKNISPHCTVCDPKCLESIQHLFLDCKIARAVNAYFGTLWKEWTNEDLQFSESYLLLEFPNSAYKSILRQFTIVTLYAIWNVRNLRDFDSETILTETGAQQYLLSEFRFFLSTLWVDLQTLNLPRPVALARMNEVLLHEKVGSLKSGVLQFTEWSTRNLSK